MNRRAFLSRLVTAPVVLGLPVPVMSRQRRPSLLIPKLNQPVSLIEREMLMAALAEQFQYELQAVGNLWHAERLQLAGERHG